MRTRRMMYSPLVLLLMASPGYASDSGATVSYQDVTHKLTLHGSCRVAENGAYNFWAVTPDENEPGVAKDGAPRLQAISSGEWSRLTFYVDGTEPAAVIVGEGEDMVRMSDGSLNYTGPAGEGSDQTISIRVDC